jgi:transcriptional regulator with XRE-family HTH domain
MSEIRKILSMNIRKARSALHITQAKLALYSDISLPHMTEIEQCRTWVSDKTLAKIAKTLNMEAYQLLIPADGNQDRETGQKDGITRQMAKLTRAKKIELKKNIDDAMDSLILEIIKLNDTNG